MYQTLRSLVPKTAWRKLALLALVGAAASLGQAQTSFSTPQVLSGDWGAVTNDNTGVVPDAGNPGIAGNYPNAPLWYAWTAPADGEVSLDTIGSLVLATNAIPVFTNSFPFYFYVTNVAVVKLDTVLGVYTGDNVAQLTQIAANDDLFPVYQENYTAQNVFSVDSSNAPVPVSVPLSGFYSSSSSFSQQIAIGGIESYYYQPYFGPSGLRFNAKGGMTYYFSVDTKYSTYGFSSSSTLYGPVVLNWAYHPSGVFRFASENIDQTGVRDTNGFAMLLYQTSETETSRRLSGTVNADFLNTTYHTYYPYDVPGVLVTVTRTAGSSGRVQVGYTTVDGTTNLLTNGDAPARAGFDYFPVSGTLTFNDFEMSKTILIPIVGSFGPGKNRDFTVVLTNIVIDPGESPAVAPPRLDPVYYQALVRILDVDIDPKGPSVTTIVDTNQTPSVTNFVYSLTPTNGVFNFTKANYRVPRDVSDVWGGTPITVYVNRTGTNKESETVHWSINSYFLDKAGGDINRNIYFPLQPGSDYATPDPANAGVRGLTPDFNFSSYEGTITFPGGNNVNPQPIQFTVYNNGSNQFNEDFHIDLYGLDKDGNPYQEGMLAECTVTILFDDQHPPAGSVDEKYNPDYGLKLAPPINTTPQMLSHPGTDPFGLGNVYGLAVLPNDETVIVGEFASYNGIGRNGIALLQTNGALDTAFAPTSGANDFITTVALASGNRFLIAGNFTAFNGAAAPRVARINPNGTLDGTFTPGTGADGTVWAMARQSDGKILIGGDFTHYNGTNRFYLARLNTNGTLDATFVCTNITGTVNAIAVQGTNIYVGGEFSVAGQVYREIARFNTNGVLDTSFDPGVGPDATVYAIATQPDGQVVIGGAFTHVNGTALNSLARLGTDGTVDTANFYPGTGADNIIYSVNVNADGTIYIGGAFTSFNGTRRMGFARLFTDGTVDTSFMDTAYNQFAGLPKIYFGDPNGVVFTSGVQSDGNVMIGGSFDQVGGGQFSALVASNSVPPNYDPNVWPEPKARDGIRNRSNIARLIGGATPGPGNIGLSPDSPEGYSANKSQQYKFISLIRTNGTLGPLSANFVANNGQAKGGVDFVYNALDPLYWIEWEYITGGSRMHSDGLFGVNGYVSDIYGNFWVGEIPDLSQVLLTLYNNASTSGDLNAGFQLSNPSLADQFYLGGQTIPLGGALGRSSAPFTLIDDNRQAGTFGFAADTFVATNLSAAISVVRSNGLYGTVSLRYSTANGTATNNVDYSGLTNVIMNFLSGVVSNSFNVAIKDNGYIYTNAVEKTVNLRLSSLNAAGGNAAYGISNATLRLLNPNYQGYLTLSSSNYSSAESSGVISFIVNRTSGSKGALSVQYATVDGTAVGGVDYVGATNVLTWNDGDVSPRKITLTLINHQVVGASKQFSVALSNPLLNGAPTPSLFSFYTNATLTIINDNSYGNLQFNVSSYVVNEDAGTATITVTRTVGAGGTVSVNYATADGTAVNGLNYLATNGTLTLAPGQLSASFNVRILNDGVQDPLPFYFNVDLSGFGNASPGSPVSAQIQILDVQSYNRPPGVPDVAFDPNTTMNDDVLALALQSDGKILAGGAFTQVGTTPKNRIARLNTDGSLDATFLNGLTGANGSVLTLANQTDDRLLLGGTFNFINGISRGYIARMLADGSLDTSFNPGSGANSSVYALAETFIGGVRKIYIGGAFSSFNSVSWPHVARLNNNGTLDTGFAIGTGADDAVYAVAVYPTNSIFAGKVLIGGGFTHYNGVALNHIARLNADGSVDASFNAGTGANDIIRAITIQADGRVLIGGNFTAVNGTTVNHVARLNTDGSLDTDFASNLGPGANNIVTEIAVQPDTRIVIAGLFSQVGGASRGRLARLLSTGALDASISFGTGANDTIDAMLLQPNDGMIVIGGAFTQFNGQAHDRIARIYGGSSTGGSVVIPAGAALVQESFAPANGILDPNENVTMLFAFRNSAGTNVNNLMATLLATNGVKSPNPATQAYGPLIVQGGSVSRAFSFQVDPSYTNGQQIVATFQLVDGATDLGTVSFGYMLGTSTNRFYNTNAIVINDNTNASLYPSTINVSGMNGALLKAIVTLTNLNHSWPADIGAMVKSPAQQGVLLMANSGGSFPLHNTTLAFDDSAAGYLPQSSQIVSGTFKPSSYLTVPPFPQPAPATYSNQLSAFKGGNPNGAWSLFIIDDQSLNIGIVSNGWYLTLTSANPVGTVADVGVALTASPSPVIVSNNVTYLLTVTNYGPSTATNVIVNNTLPTGATLVSVTGPGTLVTNGLVLQWMVGTLATNTGAALTIVVKPTITANLTDTASVASDTTDVNPDNNSASVTVTSQSAPPQLTGSYVGSDGAFHFNVSGYAGSSVIVQASTNLVNWLNLYTNQSPFTYTNLDATNYSQRFYRAVVAP